MLHGHAPDAAQSFGALDPKPGEEEAHGETEQGDDLDDRFWNAPFGAALPVSEIDDLAGYFAEGATLSGR